jgi:hypothetical protein
MHNKQTNKITRMAAKLTKILLSVLNVAGVWCYGMYASPIWLAQQNPSFIAASLVAGNYGKRAHGCMPCLANQNHKPIVNIAFFGLSKSGFT